MRAASRSVVLVRATDFSESPLSVWLDVLNWSASVSIRFFSNSVPWRSRTVMPAQCWWSITPSVSTQHAQWCTPLGCNTTPGKRNYLINKEMWVHRVIHWLSYFGPNTA